MARDSYAMQVRQRRLRHAATLRQRARRRQTAFVSTSFGVFVASLIGMWAVAGLFGDHAPVGPLYITAGPAPATQTASPHPPTPPNADLTDAPTLFEGATRLSPAPSEPRPSVDHPEDRPTAIATEPARTHNAFARKPVQRVDQRRMLVTAYCPNACCCGKHANGKTASGHSVRTNGGKLVAADTRILPFGSLVQIPGYDQGNIVPVLDRGGKIKGNRLDLLMPTHAQAKQWGARWVTVSIYDYR